MTNSPPECPSSGQGVVKSPPRCNSVTTSCVLVLFWLFRCFSELTVNCTHTKRYTWLCCWWRNLMKLYQLCNIHIQVLLYSLNALFNVEDINQEVSICGSKLGSEEFYYLNLKKTEPLLESLLSVLQSCSELQSISVSLLTRYYF